MKPRMMTSSQVFAEMGNPWISERERMADFRLTSFDDPEKDQYTKAGRDRLKAKEEGDKLFKLPRDKKVGPDYEAAHKKMMRARKLAIISHRMNMKFAKHKG